MAFYEYLLNSVLDILHVWAISFHFYIFELYFFLVFLLQI